MQKAIVIFLKKLAYNFYSKLFITTDLGFYFFVGLFVLLVKTGYVYEAYMFDYSQLMVKIFLFIIDLSSSKKESRKTDSKVQISRFFSGIGFSISFPSLQSFYRKYIVRIKF
jgi:hypothetical protein